MNKIDYLFVMLGEEAAEVAKEAAKVLRFGPTEIYEPIGITNAERVERELTDLFAVVLMLSEEGVINFDNVFNDERAKDKILKVQKYLAYSASLGRVT